MRNFLSILSLIGVVAGVHSRSAGAVELGRVGDPPAQLLPIDTSAPEIPCDQILHALLKFNDMNRQHEDSVSAFLIQAVEKINGWYDALSPLEGQLRKIEPGTFEPIGEAGKKMSMIVDYSYDNTALLAQELDRILVSLRQCDVVPLQKQSREEPTGKVKPKKPIR